MRSSASSPSTPRPSRPGDTFNRGVLVGVVRAGHLEADRPAAPSTTASASSGTRRGGGPTTSPSNFRPELYDPTQRAGAVPAGGRQRPAPRAEPAHRRARRPRCSSARSCRARAIRRTAWRSPTTRACRAGSARCSRPQIEPRLGFAYDVTRRRQDGAARERRPLPQLAARRRLARQPAQPAVHHQSDPLLRDDGHDAAAGRAASSDRPVNANALERDAKTPSSFSAVDRRRPRHRLGHGRRRVLRRQRRPPPRDGVEHQRGAGRGALPRSQSAERRSAHERGAAGGIPASVPRLPGHLRPRQLRHVELQRAAGAGEPALHPRRAVRRVVHVGPRARHRRRRSGARVDRATDARVELRGRGASTRITAW